MTQKPATPKPETQNPATRSLFDVTDQLMRRKATEKRFRRYGQTAILVSILMLLALLFTVFFKGVGAFQQTFITREI